MRGGGMVKIGGKVRGGVEREKNIGVGGRRTEGAERKKKEKNKKEQEKIEKMRKIKKKEQEKINKNKKNTRCCSSVTY